MSEVDLHDDDRARIVAYLDGELDGADKLAFEMRMAEDERLAAEFESFARMDEAQWTAARATPAAPTASHARTARPEDPFPSHAPWRRLAAAAAILLLAAVAIRTAFFRAEPSIDFVAAAIPSDATLVEYADRHGLDGSLFRAELRSGDPGDERLPATEQHARITAVESDAVTAALGDDAEEELRANFYRLPVRAAEDCVAVVIRIGAEPGSREAYATREGPPRALQAGEAAVLPPVGALEPGAGQSEARFHFEPGFLVPLRAGEIRAVIALRQNIDVDELSAIDRVLRDLDAAAPLDENAARLTSTLAGRGYASRAFRIVEVP